MMCDPVREFLESPVDCSVVDKDEVDVFPDSIPRVLLIKGLPDHMDNTLLRQCLQTQFKNAGHEVFDCVIEGTMAYIKFSDSAGTEIHDCPFQYFYSVFCTHLQLFVN